MKDEPQLLHDGGQRLASLFVVCRHDVLAILTTEGSRAREAGVGLG